MKKSKHAGPDDTRLRARRTNTAITLASLAVALWLGFTAPQVSPVAPLPAPAPAAAPARIALAAVMASARRSPRPPTATRPDLRRSKR